MKKLSFDKFARFITTPELNSKINGGNVFLDIASYPKTSGGTYMWSYGTSTNDFSTPNGCTVLVFSDGRGLTVNCQ